MLITGLPRAGTTLVCHLLNKLPNVIALHEPMDFQQLNARAGQSELLEFIQGFIDRSRDSLLQSSRAYSRAEDGRITSNPVDSSSSTKTGLRPGRHQLEQVHFEGPLDFDFVLLLKHNASFTALLDNLISRYPVFAVIRNPLALLCSWQTVDLPIHDGHIPMAERFDDALARALAQVSDRIDRQLLILEWFFQNYSLLPPSHVLKYEDTVASGGRSLSQVLNTAKDLAVPLASMNANPLYPREHIIDIGERLLKRDGDYWKYYSRSDIQSLMVSR